jgi:hypothetical protein
MHNAQWTMLNAEGSKSRMAFGIEHCALSIAHCPLRIGH